MAAVHLWATLAFIKVEHSCRTQEFPIAKERANHLASIFGNGLECIVRVGVLLEIRKRPWSLSRRGDEKTGI